MRRKLQACIVLLHVLLLLSNETQGQKTLKLPPGVTTELLKTARSVLIVTTNKTLLPAGVWQRDFGNTNLFWADPRNINLDSLMNDADILFIQPLRQATEEMIVNGSDLSLNNIFFSHDQFPAVTGKGLTALLKENRPDSLDIDFYLRYFRTGLESNALSAHATTMATLIGGAGNTYYTGKGAAFKTNMGSVSFQVLLPEHDSVYKKFRASVQNHSYGTGIENFYGADSWAYDISVKNNDSLLHVFSAGNSGTQTSSAGKYAGIPGFANLTGSFKQTKNSLSIAATDSFYNVELLSSRGPAYDGRIKPELVAFGQDGSSGAAALVSGSALLVQEAYKQQAGKLPSSSLVRAALVNGADDVLQPGPDYRSGFGSLNTERAVRQVINNRYFSGAVTNGSQQQFMIIVPPNTKGLKITLAWNDMPAAINAAKALVNDLDLELVEVSSGTIHYPRVLNHFPHIDSLNAVALAKKDTLNNIEQVMLDLHTAGDYIIRIKGSAVQGSQSFDVVYNWESTNSFRFTYPTKNDNLYPGALNTIRWNSFTDAATTGKLEITYNGADWITLHNTATLSNKYYRSLIKDTTTVARLRMSYGSAVVLSDSFTVSSRLQVSPGFSCPDSFEIHWNKLAGVSGYTVYGLADTFMRPLYQTPDTSITIATGNIQHYAVAPRINARTGLRSFTFNHTTQGVGCFINSFLADVFDDTTVHLKAVLGTTHGIKEISFQRLYPLTTLVTFPVNKDTFTTTDRLDKDGIYYYRVKLLFNSGKEVISDTLPVRIFQQNQFIVYPNPYNNGGRFLVQSKDYDNSIFELFSILGQKVYSRTLKSETESIVLPPLQRGVYFYRIIRHNRKVFSGKLLVL